MNFSKFNSLTTLYFSQSEKLGNQPHLWRKIDNKYKSFSWQDTQKLISNFSSNLINHGILKGDRVYICSENRPEFFIADTGIMSAGGITVPGYTTNTTSSHEYIIKHCGARAAIVSNEKIAKEVMPAIKSSSKCEFLIIMDEKNKEYDELVNVYSWKDFVEEGKNNFNSTFDICKKQKRTDTACIIYTSGTGGNPKGVMLSHGAILHNCFGSNDLLKEVIEDLDEIKFLSWLPLSHSYEHTIQFLMTGWGAQTYYAESTEKLLNNMAESKPHIMCAVPRFYDTLHSKISMGLKSQNFVKRLLFKETIKLGKKLYFNKPLSRFESLKNSLLDKLVRKKVKERFGGQLKCLVSGGAALNFDVGIYLSSLGLPLLQGYGQTETAPIISTNPMTKIKLDTVGIALTGVKVKIADDGEILIKGENVMNGYWNDPDATAKTVINGWVHTGDIGEIDSEGYIKITDRKKDIIVNTGGDNISPSRIQEKLEFESEIEQSMIYGDAKNYLVAIIVPNEEFISRWARENKVDNNLYDLSSNKTFHKTLTNVVEKVNNNLSITEKVRKFIIAKEAFTIENEMMTPTLKIRRFKVLSNYGDELESLYS